MITQFVDKQLTRDVQAGEALKIADLQQ